jgi:hypothetical protein
MSTPNIDENNQQILNDIDSLQNIEKSLFSSLEDNPTLTTDQQQEIIGKISDISNMRINLYHTLNDVNGFFHSALTNSQGTLQEQSVAIGIVEQELNNAKKKLNLLEQEKNNKIRLIEINNFYGDKYAEQTKLMKLIGYILAAILFLSFLHQRQLLPQSIFLGLLFLVSIIGSYYIIIQVVSIWNRDNMNYQEYNWYFDAASAPDPSGSTTDPWASTKTPVICTESFNTPSNYYKY